jgi:quercetin dioxygenase-like cupin family protein
LVIDAVQGGGYFKARRHQMSTFDTTALDWIPLREGLSFKPIYFFPHDSGLQLLLRVEPGTVIPRHRHTGEIHAFNLSGTRLLIETDEVVGPGMYVHEPAGNVDSWTAVGDEPCVIHIEVNGRIEHLGIDDSVVNTVDAAFYRREYQQWQRQAKGKSPMPADVGGSIDE